MIEEKRRPGRPKTYNPAKEIRVNLSIEAYLSEYIDKVVFNEKRNSRADAIKLLLHRYYKSPEYYNSINPPELPKLSGEKTTIPVNFLPDLLGKIYKTKEADLRSSTSNTVSYILHRMYIYYLVVDKSINV